jgi:acyl dehydratase
MRTYYFEDFEAGQSFESAGRTITEADLTLFSMISGDWNPIHADAEFARGTRYGQRVVHGALGIAIATGRLHELGIFERSAVAMIGLRNWTFREPMFVGDTVRLRLTILAKSLGRSGRSGRVERRFELLNQRDVVVQEGESDVLVLARDAGAAERGRGEQP